MAGKAILGRSRPSSAASRLQSLNLFGNTLTGAIPPELGSLSQLQYPLGGTLTGAIPSGSASRLQWLDLHDDDPARTRQPLAVAISESVGQYP